ncbi:hypothetical protein AA13595_2602 [Gluconacetobacter johannae DSM 13595]|uniref:Uncharacterized protein n=1 Tax=Gluconacetobacter johannae TaxID=112140 RepID=A0A7W4J7K5_9PROT|nr:hypothetical protein [Gluconacetobacter johannae]MBB2176178.1 hypothetical protein [Gluconacetobacter johannae]GBQ89283.1 hypothetical protein AA13595_2602 [Gluconacetobacter johannae DSM 13595]
MSDTTMTAVDMEHEQFIATIRRMNAETEKFVAEQRKLIAEAYTSRRDTSLRSRHDAFLQWVMVVSGLVAALSWSATIILKARCW